MFAAMPSRKAGDEGYRDIAHPIKTETRTYIQNEVLKAFENMPEE